MEISYVPFVVMVISAAKTCMGKRDIAKQIAIKRAITFFFIFNLFMYLGTTRAMGCFIYVV
ncbi:MAG: hypothetical protein KAQ68_01075 [Clostridiales bacterium]|nr:hypothetical protein [Clostridiales bacterium]